MKRYLIIIMCIIELSALLGSHQAVAESKSSILIQLNEWLAAIEGDNIASLPKTLAAPSLEKRATNQSTLILLILQSE